MRNQQRSASFDLQIVGGQNVSFSNTRQAHSARHETTSIVFAPNQRVAPTPRHPRFFLSHKLPEATALSLLPDISTRVRKNQEPFAVLGKPIVLKPDQESYIGTVAQVQNDELDHQPGQSCLNSTSYTEKDSSNPSTAAGKPYSASPVVTVRRRKVRSCPPASPTLSYNSKRELVVTSVQLINKPEKEKKNKSLSRQFASNEDPESTDWSGGNFVLGVSTSGKESKVSPKSPLSPLILISSSSNRNNDLQKGSSLKTHYASTIDKDKQTAEASKMVENLISGSQKRVFLHDRVISHRKPGKPVDGDKSADLSESTDIRSLLKKYSPCQEMLTHKIINFSVVESNSRCKDKRSNTNTNSNHDKVSNKQSSVEDTSYHYKQNPDTKLKTIVLSFPGFDSQEDFKMSTKFDD